jgi:hypothetical protein
MKKIGFFLFVVCVMFAANSQAATAGIIQARDYDWANDPRSLALSTKGIEELLPKIPEPSKTTGFGELLGSWTWTELGIPGSYGYCGAGLSIDYPYLYLCDQYSDRIHIANISSGVPVPVTWFAPAMANLVWGAGMDNEPEFWFGDVYWGASTPVYEYLPYPGWSPTGDSFDAYYAGGNLYYWEADLSDNCPGDTLWWVNVGYSNHIYGAIEPDGTPVRNFGNSTWDWISQRCLAWNNDDGTFFIGGWNVNRVWEISYANGAPIPTREFRCKYPSGAAYQDTANGGPCLWVQSNSVDDILYKFGVPVLSADDISVLSIVNPYFPFVDPVPFAVKATITNTGAHAQDFETWCEVEYSPSLPPWKSNTIASALGKFTSLEYTYDPYPNGQPSGTELKVTVYVDNPGDEDPSNDEMATASVVMKDCTPYVTDRFELGNAFYFNDYRAVLAKKMSTADTMPVTLAWVAVNTASKGEPFYPWPDAIYDPVEISAWTDENEDGRPDTMPVWADTLTPSDARWVAVEVPDGSFYGKGGRVWVGFKNVEPGREGLVTDSSRLNNDTWYFWKGVWTEYNAYGDWHIRGCLVYATGVTPFETGEPLSFSLSQSNPNPARNNTSISYTVPLAGNVTIGVYNSAGMLVKTLVNEHRAPGFYTVNWDNVALSNGVYFYRLTAGDVCMTRKMVVLK